MRFELLLGVAAFAVACHPSGASVGEAGAGGEPASSGGAGTGGAQGGSGAGKLADPCSSDADCTSLGCLRGRCADACSDASDCPPSPEWTCALAPGHGLRCQCSPSGSEACDGRDNDCDGNVDDGAACPGSSACQSGSCVCPVDHQCGNDCADLDTDPAHCGACDTVCPSGASCSAGKCQCPSGTTACGDHCVDLTTDSAHCGDCNTACAALETCVSGVPTCFHTLCAGTCVDLDEDVLNCGRCGHDCLGGGCLDGACLPVQIVAGESVASITVDATHVYWNSLSKKEVRRASLDGTDVTTLAPYQDFGGIVYSPLVIHPTGWLYWGGDFCGVGRVPLDQSSSASAISSIRGWSLAFDATHVYFAGYDMDTDAIEIVKSDLDGSNPVTLWTGYTEVGEMVVGPSALYFTLPGDFAANSTLARIGFDGTGFEIIRRGQSIGSRALLLDGNSLWWSGYYDGPTWSVLVRSDLDGNNLTPVAIAATSQMVIDGQTVYYAADAWVGSDYQAGVYRVDAKKLAQRLVSGNWIVDIAQDATHVYYSVATTPAIGIWRLAK